MSKSRPERLWRQVRTRLPGPPAALPQTASGPPVATSWPVRGQQEGVPGRADHALPCGRGVDGGSQSRSVLGSPSYRSITGTLTYDPSSGQSCSLPGRISALIRAFLGRDNVRRKQQVSRSPSPRCPGSSADIPGPGRGRAASLPRGDTQEPGPAREGGQASRGQGERS